MLNAQVWWCWVPLGPSGRGRIGPSAPTPASFFLLVAPSLCHVGGCLRSCRLQSFLLTHTSTQFHFLYGALPQNLPPASLPTLLDHVWRCHVCPHQAWSPGKPELLGPPHCLVMSIESRPFLWPKQMNKTCRKMVGIVLVFSISEPC